MTDQNKFAPTPMHGAAYAVAIETVGGVFAIGDCDTRERYQERLAKLNDLQAWSRTQTSDIQAAYRWGVEKVHADLKARLEVHENSRSVKAALATIPKPASFTVASTASRRIGNNDFLAL